MKWKEIIELPSVNVIMGFRRRGKSALGFYLTEELGNHYGLKKVVFGFPPHEKQLLPEEYIITSDIESIPSHSVVLVDEVFLFAHSRRSMKNANILFDKLTAMSGKQKQIIIYITHHSRKMDRNLILDTDNLIYKKPSKLQIEMERPEIKPFSRKAYDYLKDRGKEWSYLFSFVNDVESLMRNPLPFYWREEISDVTYVEIEDNDKLELKINRRATDIYMYVKELEKELSKL